MFCATIPFVQISSSSMAATVVKQNVFMGLGFGHWVKFKYLYVNYMI